MPDHDDPMQPWDNEATWCDEHICPLVVCEGLPHVRDMSGAKYQSYVDERLEKDGKYEPGIYNKMISRTTDGSDPLVQEPKGKP